MNQDDRIIDRDNLIKTHWNIIWKEAVLKMPHKDDSKYWDNIAPKFNQWMEKDDYPRELVSKIKIEEGDTVFDIGCGNGAITIPLAKKAKSVTALDSSVKMLDILKEKANAEKLTNIKILNERIEDVKAHEIDPHEVVVASRSLNGIPDIQKELEKINEISQKHVYLTFWGEGSREFENEISKLLGRETHEHPNYTIVLNILQEMGIRANAVPLESDTRNFYSNMEETLDRIEWRVGEMNEDEKVLVKKHLSKVMVKETDGGLSYSQNNSKWILVSWEKNKI
ncbi:MAG: methyltransferase domain-containing protein [Methanobacterium sp.]|nr:MAG: methyltransferase domain-containing protein [Methanobacterium sp.]